MTRKNILFLSIFFSVQNILDFTRAKGNWECRADGFWYEDGVKSQYSGCEEKKDGSDKAEPDKKAPACNGVQDSRMPSDTTRVCFQVGTNPRCVWFFVPSINADSQNRLPLVVDMHGGGGCPSDQALNDGFKDLSASLGNSGFAIIYPSGYGNQWGTCGADCTEIAREEEGKSVHSVDDISFLSQMLAWVVNNKSSANPLNGKVDPTRIYFTGFSMGCMMTHRFALERSQYVAAAGCHGGRLIIKSGSDPLETKVRFKVSPVPVFLTGGSNDEWFSNTSFFFWSALDGCSNKTNTSSFKLSNNVDVVAFTRSDCGSDLGSDPRNFHISMLVSQGGFHVIDPAMASLTWQYFKQFQSSDSSSDLSNEDVLSVVEVPENEAPTATTLSTNAAVSGKMHMLSAFMMMISLCAF